MQKERENFLEKAYKGFDCSKNRGLKQNNKSEKGRNGDFKHFNTYLRASKRK